MRTISTKLDLQAFINSLEEPGENDHKTRTFFQNRGIKHRSIATALGVSPSLVSKVMSGKTNTSDIVDFNLRSLAMVTEKFEIYGVAT